MPPEAATLMIAILAGLFGLMGIATAFKGAKYKNFPVQRYFWAGVIGIIIAVLMVYVTIQIYQPPA